MHLSVFHTCAVAHIYGKLKHGETVALKPLAEQHIFLLVLLGFSGKVKKYKNPHNTIFAKTVHNYFSFLSDIKTYRICYASQFASETFVERSRGLRHGNHQWASFPVYHDIDGGDAEQTELDLL